MTVPAAEPPSRNAEPRDADTYRVPEAARADVSERTVWRLIDAKKLAGVVRIGRSVRISKVAFHAWLAGAK